MKTQSRSLLEVNLLKALRKDLKVALISERQIEVLENIANPPVKPVNQAQLDLVDKAFSISPRSRFLKSLKADVEMGRTFISETVRCNQ